MESFIGRIWNGDLSPGRVCGMENPEIRELQVLVERCGEQLERSLEREQQRLLERFVNNMDEYLRLLMEQAFCDGFCTGGRLVAEVFLGANNPA